MFRSLNSNMLFSFFWTKDVFLEKGKHIQIDSFLIILPHAGLGCAAPVFSELWRAAHRKAYRTANDAQVGAGTGFMAAVGALVRTSSLTLGESLNRRENIASQRGIQQAGLACIGSSGCALQHYLHLPDRSPHENVSVLRPGRW